jgi:hypothetical protein
MTKRILAGLIVAFWIPVLATGQTQPVDVAVEASVGENDIVGNRLVYAVKEQLRKSQAF